MPDLDIDVTDTDPGGNATYSVDINVDNWTNTSRASGGYGVLTNKATFQVSQDAGAQSAGGIVDTVTAGSGLTGGGSASSETRGPRCHL